MSEYTSRSSSALLAALISTCCSAPLMKVPSMPPFGGPGPLLEAQSNCVRLQTLRVDLMLRGAIRGHVVSGVALHVDLTKGTDVGADAARVDAVGSSGVPLFEFAAEGNDATVLLPRQNRKLEHGRPEVVLDTLIGVRLRPSALRVLLTGCAPEAELDMESISQVGNDWLAVPLQHMVPGEVDRLFLHREREGPWRIVAATHHEERTDGWRAEYRDFQNGLPHSIRVISYARGRVDLHLSLSRVDVDLPLDGGAFRLRIPTSAAPMTLGEMLARPPIVQATAHGS